VWALTSPSVREDPAVTLTSLVLRNLLRRPARSALTAAGVAIGVGLIVALLSLAAGVRRTANDLIHVGRADFGLFQSGVVDFTRSLLPNTLAARIRGRPGVEDAAPLKLLVASVGGHDGFLVFGLERDSFPARRLVVVAGRRGGLLVGDHASRRLHVGPGEAIEVAGRRFRVAGVYHSGNSFEDGGVVLPIDLVERLAGHPGEATTVAVAVAPGRRPTDVARELRRRFPGLAAVTDPGQAVKVDTSSRLVLETGWIVSILALIVGGIGVTNTMAMAVLERTREIGILRAVGWRSRRVAVLVLGEAVAICLLALGLGLALGLAADDLLTRRGTVSELVRPEFTAGVFAWGLAFACGVALLGAAYPVWRAVRLTPIAALRHE
jgi:putative ABC transport system permease protein